MNIIIGFGLLIIGYGIGMMRGKWIYYKYTGNHLQDLGSCEGTDEDIC